jgi:hypothetical protein
MQCLFSGIWLSSSAASSSSCPSSICASSGFGTSRPCRSTYEPFIPLNGPEADLLFDDSASNQALIELRRFITGFIERFEPETPQIWQWPRNIET